MKQDTYFRSDVMISTSSETKFHAIDEAIAEIGESINLSGYFKNMKLDINLFRYRPIGGSSYLPLPPIIANRKACINIQNNNDKCFTYSVLASENPTMKDPQRQSNTRILNQNMSK